MLIRPPRGCQVASAFRDRLEGQGRRRLREGVLVEAEAEAELDAVYALCAARRLLAGACEAKTGGSRREGGITVR
eukprot:7695486-Pyramimonas_sp.AAC.1